MTPLPIIPFAPEKWVVRQHLSHAQSSHIGIKREKNWCVCGGGGGGGEGVRLRHHRDQCGDTDPARLLVKSVYVLIYLL